MVQMPYGLRLDGLKLKSMLSISVKHTFCAIIAHNFDDWGYSKSRLKYISMDFHHTNGLCWTG